jgi:lambda family phage portal protein
MIDSAIAIFDPARAVKRQAHRQALSYVAGEVAPRGKDWRASRKGPNAELRTTLAFMRARSREMIRDNAMAARMVSIRVAHEIGYGITPRSATGDEALDQRVIALWNRFVAQSDLHGRLNLYAQQMQMARCRSEAGEALMRIVRLTPAEARRLGLAVPLLLEVLEPDLLDDTTPLVGATEALRVAGGIEFDRQGRPVAYRLLRDHPGEGLAPLATNGVRYDRVPAADMIHIYRAHQQRPNQARGVPDLAPVMMRMRRLEEYEEAAVEQAKVQALLGVFYEQKDPLDPQGNPIERGAGDNGAPPLEVWPGMVGELPPGMEAKFLQPSGSGAFEPYAKHEQRMIAAGFAGGLPYDLATGDLSDTNYSSMRGGKVAFRITIEQDQWGMHIPMMCDPIWQAFTQAAVLFGALPARPDGYPVRWNPPPFQMLDPGKEIPPMIEAVRAGFATWDQTVAGQGFDPREQAAEIQRTNEDFDRRGLILTTDPRRVASSGQAQDAKQNAAVEIGARGNPAQPSDQRPRVAQPAT